MKYPAKQQQDPGDREELQRELEDLQKRVHRLQLEHDILVKANELLQKDPAD